MTSRHSLAKLAMRELADAPVDVGDVSRRDADAAIAEIARELAAVGKRRRRRWTTMIALGMAAAVVLAVGMMTWGRGSVVTTASVDSVAGGVRLVRGDHGRSMVRGDAVAQGDRVIASAGGSATLHMRDGTELRAVRGTDVFVAEQGLSQVFELRAGTVQLHVAKLQTGERFIVRTGDAEVEVRGTEFSVEVGEICAGSTTRVAVREGTVVVRHAGVEARVTANESWPAGCDRQASAASSTPPPRESAPPSPSSAPPPPTSAPPPPATAPPAPPVVAPPSPVAAQRTGLGPANAPAPAPARPVVAPSSELAEQNRLFADAMAAKRRGDVPATLSALNRLSSAHPTGPLAESAHVERMRVLVNVDRKRASDAARAYLARYPNGYARGEARALIAAP